MKTLSQRRLILVLFAAVFFSCTHRLGAQEGFKGERTPNPTVHRSAPAPKAKTTGKRPPAQPARVPIGEQIEDAIERGNTARDADKLPEAEEQYRRAISLSAGDWRAWYGLGNVLNDVGNYDQAVEALTEALRLNADSAEAHHSRGTSYFLKEQFSQAIQEYRESIRLRPDYTYAYYDLGMAYVKLKDTKAALEQYQILKRLNPGLADNLRSYIR